MSSASMALQMSPAQLEMLCQESQQSSLLAMEWFFTIVAIIVVSLRLYCRTKFGKGFYWDDYTFVASVIIGLPDPFLVTKWVHTGLGKHIECLGLDAFTDLVCSGIPTFVLYRMQMNTRTKVALCVLMGLGVFTAMCAVAKAITLKEIWSRDFTWNAVIVVKWACAEQALSLILVSLPILRPLFRNFFTLTKAGRSPPKAPARGGRFHRIPPPNHLLFKSTNDSSSLRKGNIAPYASIQVLYADRRLPQMPLVARQVQPRVELNVRVEHDDLERGQWVGP
ncbi:hypothetical protein HO133_003841 [Letharia lupina]|uniref:Rhodopsin domain-containing protein n=1 Tax=Letharia lupina TaxID=560253 RepID=A0A8H6CB86_9LECA|nr:uncharacterized protein HO133_003841 [Letharia lupina]KAF6220016.1 hypothetical protein HO133_003841 [Letharia lupina]